MATKRNVILLFCTVVAGLLLAFFTLDKKCQEFGLQVGLGCGRGIYVYKNVADSPLIQWGKGWRDRESKTSGDEINFSFARSANVIISATFSGQDSQQKLYINTGSISHSLSPERGKPSTIIIPASKNIDSTHVRIWHSCPDTLSCGARIQAIYLQRDGAMLSPAERKKTMVIFGDSISKLYDMDNYSYKVADMLGYFLVNEGVYGSTASPVKGQDYSYLRYESIAPYKPDIIIIFLGTNDLAFHVTPSDFRTNYQNLLTAIKRTNPQAKIYAPGILLRQDAEVDSYNRIIADTARSLGVTYLDTTGWLAASDLVDEVHPSLQSQEKLARRFLEVLRKEE